MSRLFDLGASRKQDHHTMFRIKFVSAASILALAAPVFAQSPVSPNAAPPPPPMKTMVMPVPAAADMQAVLDQLQALGAKPIEMLTPVKARIQPSAADAARAVMRMKGISTAPDPAVATMDMPYGADPMQFARIYKPAGGPNGQPMPVIVYYHGGGWVIADVTTYDATPRLMSKQLNAIVVSVEYRHAPEAKFPAQHDDAAAAYRWVLQNAGSWGGDSARIALAGESAGGNLAVATAIYARDNNLTAPLHVLAVYPIANSGMTLLSRSDSANAKPLNTTMLKWFGYYYSNTMADQMDPRINLVKADLHGLPPTTIVNAQIDPLRSDGETLAEAMRGAGDKVEQRTFPGVTHEFFGMGTIVRGAYDAEMYAIGRLGKSFDKAR
ncbi:alpha/beta hydrolase [Sphingomonas immobilis]|uniref:Alpha/beta hydrolase n=1 Tax=Sphingomonas immobilis TaxID=3063997 RepID=A0ABT8ZWD7_9SPHN|nr:alpha/beta hydrolase [Sphingomonas sp. CA1-15]MDO7841890.1 alpha/beta hydrolase [Sphingomonas sp. CA1-15]